MEKYCTNHQHLRVVPRSVLCTPTHTHTHIGRKMDRQIDRFYVIYISLTNLSINFTGIWTTFAVLCTFCWTALFHILRLWFQTQSLAWTTIRNCKHSSVFLSCCNEAFIYCIRTIFIAVVQRWQVRKFPAAKGNWSLCFIKTIWKNQNLGCTLIFSLGP